MRTYIPKITEDQAEALLPLEEVKRWAKVQHALEDDLLKRLRLAVIRKCEKFCGKLFVRREITAYPQGRDYSDCGRVYLPYATNVSDLTVIRAEKGKEPGLIAEDSGYFLFGLPNGVVRFPYSFRGYDQEAFVHLVFYTTGYDPAVDDVDDFIVACQQIITGYFAHRKEFETGTIVVKIPFQAQSDLRSYMDNPLFV